jgi:arylsulfatase A-like enzyme
MSATRPPIGEDASRRSAFWPTVWLVAILVLAKAVHWSLPDLTARRIGEYLTDVGVSAHEDVLFAIGTGVLFQAGLWLGERSSQVGRILWAAFLAVGAFSALYAVASIQIFAFLRSPLTYPLLYVAGDMKSMRSSIGSFISPAIAAGLAGAPLAFLLLVRLSRGWSPPPPTRRRVAGRILLGGALAAYLFAAHQAAAGRWKDRDDHLILRNPHWAFLSSTAAEIGGGRAIHIDTAFPPGDLADFEPVLRPPAPKSGPRPRNVLLVVMESTGARYLSLYGSKYDTTPSLVREAKQALVFDSFYCHIGMTANSLAGMSLSIYPYMTWREYTVEYPRLPGVTLAQVARDKGLRTAFIHTGDLSYVGQGEFLKDRGFDVMRDIRDLGGEWIGSWGGDDKVMVDGVLRWIDEDPGKPFYALAWTQMSHHPYDPRPGQPLVDFFSGEHPEDDYDLGRYLNTLQQVDHELGRLFDGLRERKLLDDTLVLVTGDHGEAFGDPHPTWGHGFRLYQEGIRIPLMVVNPRLFPVARRLATVGGHVDINPTVTHLMGWAPSKTWEGRSLFDPARPPRTYFYAANEDYLLGVREGDWKYIYNATRGREELYDLSRDPEERENRAPEEAARCQRLRQRLAAWKDHTARHLARLRAEGGEVLD